MNALQYNIMISTVPFIYRAPHANRPTAPRPSKGRKYWKGMSLFKKSRAKLDKRRFAV